MKDKTRSIALSAMCSALAVIILILAAVIPSGRLALTAVAGLAMILVVLRCGLAYAFGAFIVSGLLALLLSPLKGCALLYLLFLGWYPIVKSPVERIRKRPYEWALKLVVFNAAFAVAFFLMKEILYADMSMPLLQGWFAALFWLAANVIFVLYDLAIGQLIAIYLNKFAKK